jgi:circadian clock protein KaiB
VIETNAVKAAKTRRVLKSVKKSQAARRKATYVLRLYVAGASDRSRQAILRARQLCETELGGDFDLEVIDVYQQPILARNGQIIATPTLVKELPPPVRRFIGDLSNVTGLFVGLDVATRLKAVP